MGQTTEKRIREMIQRLEYETHKDGNGNVYGSIPSDAEIIAKVNEVIDVLNQMLKREEQIIKRERNERLPMQGL